MQNETSTPPQDYKDGLAELQKVSARLALLKAVRELIKANAPQWCIALLEEMVKEYE